MKEELDRIFSKHENTGNIPAIITLWKDIMKFGIDTNPWKIEDFVGGELWTCVTKLREVGRLPRLVRYDGDVGNHVWKAWR